MTEIMDNNYSYKVNKVKRSPGTPHPTPSPQKNKQNNW